MFRIKCDNTAAIVLATGEGSWRTKSAANKVHQVKEKVENGLIEVTYVSTKDQCADSLTKYLKGGEIQKKASMQLSLIDLDHWLPGKDLVTRAKKVQFSTGLSCSNLLLNIFSVRIRMFQRILEIPLPEERTAKSLFI